MNKYLYMFGTFIFFLLFLKFFLGIGNIFLGFLGISGIIVYLLSHIKATYAFIMSVFIVIINFVALTFAIIPVYDEEVDVSSFYANQSNYINFNINDDLSILEKNNARIIIKSSGERIKTYNLFDENIGNIDIKEDYIITFASLTKDIESDVVINLRDGTIIRIFPQTTIKFQDLIKENKNLLNSKTSINIENGKIWFSLVRTILSDDGFNINTSNGTLVIRGTSGYVEHDLQSGTSTVFSFNHLIEFVNNEGEKFLINKKEGLQIIKNSIENIDINKFIEIKGQETYKKINRFFQKDSDIINNYKNKIINYVKNNYSGTLEMKGILASISSTKLFLMKYFDEEYENNYKNLQKYNAIVGNSEIEGYMKYLDDAIIVPVNENFNKIKLNLLDLLSQDNMEIAKSYVINKYNKALDLGENINISDIEDFIKGNIDLNKIFDIIKYNDY
ncbi:FecR domain-containing protein [Candidatus Vampirococcus lugosii]|uniref:FecR protein domain-containing protein n=1 Tax=Candidatus Vampirococcus lugosii TaxID=2789015 RepID=A0ABS5QKU2_9BACT|nr:FecR domain-containing protein [Candidatus Vampirococcus lugosii]MBS8121835.1 hypothetical protein [Candidatus Vampirococcus lugosii]